MFVLSGGGDCPGNGIQGLAAQQEDRANSGHEPALALSGGRMAGCVQAGKNRVHSDATPDPSRPEGRSG